MRFAVNFALLFAGITFALVWEGMESLPDGLYRGEISSDGSTTVQSLSDPSLNHTFYLAPETESHVVLKKRLTSCWGNVMDVSGTDAAIDGLRRWADVPGGRTITTPADIRSWEWSISEGMMAYYCVNEFNTVGNVDLNDINYAVSQMDAACPRYTAGFFEWPGTYEIVGKCAQGTAVCLGGLKG